MPVSETFRYYQISHFLNSLIKDLPVPLKFTNYETWCGNLMEQKGGVSVIYSSLASDSSKLPYMKAWEEELGMDCEVEDWNKAFARSYAGIRNASLIEANLKVMTRWYLVPSRLAKMFPSSSPQCFRDCKLTGTMAHVWWECPRIRNVWNKVFHVIFKVTGHRLQNSPGIALLNWPIPKISKSTQKLIQFIFLGTKLSIAKAWKQGRVAWRAIKNKISWIMTQEKLISVLLDRVQQFEKTWEPWANYIGVSFTPGLS